MLGKVLNMFLKYGLRPIERTNISTLSQRPSKLRTTLRLNPKYSGFKHLWRLTCSEYGLLILWSSLLNYKFYKFSVDIIACAASSLHVSLSCFRPTVKNFTLIHLLGFLVSSVSVKWPKNMHLFLIWKEIQSPRFKVDCVNWYWESAKRYSLKHGDIVCLDHDII